MSHLPPEEAAKHVTIWNRHECRKIAGNAAPLRRNLEKYLSKHPECEEYNGQDKDPHRANNAGAIDPVTGETIGPQNEHVPIWHALERRKVTGNAAPLKKNLANYLIKHPHCEVYKGQDKKPPPAQPNMPQWTPIHAHHLPNNAPLPHSIIDNPAAIRWSHPHQNKQMWPPPHAHQANQLHQQHHHHQPHHFTTPAVAPPQPSPSPPNELTYHDMVSSWSNNPDWNTSYVPGPGSLGVPTTPQHTSILATQLQQTPHIDTADNINGIPIPGGVARDRPDIVMGASMGASLGASGPMNSDLLGFLGMTPRSIDHEDIMQFSPSNYFSAGPISERSTPTMRFPYLASPPASLPHQ